MNRLFLLLFSCLLLVVTINAQVYVYVNGPSAISPCQELPIEIQIINDQSDPLENVEVRVENLGDYMFINGSQSNDNLNFIKIDGNDVVFNLKYLDACEEDRFILLFEHSCSLDRIDEMFDVNLKTLSGEIKAKTYIVNLYNVQLSTIGLRLFFDTTDQKFKKTYRIFNTGRVVLDSFSIAITNQDKMDILSSNLGQLSFNGDLLWLYPDDNEQIGNFNRYFEPGEFMDIVQIIDINACDQDILVKHKISIPCGTNNCVIEHESNLGFLNLVSEPILFFFSLPDTVATPCEEGLIKFRMLSISRYTGFDQGSALYDLVLNLGWSVYRRPNRTNPMKDNCLELVGATINGHAVNLTKNGFSGYGLKFDNMRTDPDGPGGMSDIDGDGFYDDLYSGSSLDINLIYKMKMSCLKFSCKNEVFETRYFRINSTYRNYCNVKSKADRFINHNLSWTKPSMGISSLDKVYTDLDEDTISINLFRGTNGFLKECKNDSAIVTITIPKSVEVIKGAVIIVNKDTVQYIRKGNQIIIYSNTTQFRIQIPIILHCKKGSGGGGGVNTACTTCYGSGLPRSNIKVNVDYFCNAGCYNKIPLYCHTSPAFVVACKGGGAGIISEGKFVIDSLYVTRKTIGHVDSTMTKKANKDSINLSDLMTYDTFDLTIPLDIRCTANYKNVLIKLIQRPYYIGNQKIGFDTLQAYTYFTDTLKFYDAETDKWSYCTNVLGKQYISMNRQVFYKQYIREVNISNLINSCLKGRFSTPDSLVYIVSGVVQNVTPRNFLRATIQANISYNQDGCKQAMTKTLYTNIYTGQPFVGGVYLDQPYLRDTLFRGFYRALSVCGIFTMRTNVDSYYSFTKDKEPFNNEFRKPYIIDEIKYVIPPIFNYIPQSSRYIEEFRNSITNVITKDTISLIPTIRDSAGYHILTFKDFQKNKNFKAINNVILIDIEPNCYGFVNDTIWTTKRVRYHLQSDNPAHHKVIIDQRALPIMMSGVAPIFGNKDIQPLKDSVKIWDFVLYSLTHAHRLAKYFSYDHSWMTLQNPSGHIIIDSLIEIIDSNTHIKYTPRILANNTHIYQLDTTWLNRNFRLFTSYDQCGEDSLIVRSGSSCDAYPDFEDNVHDYCDEISDYQLLNYNPEPARLEAIFLTQPDSILILPCDTFYYEIKILNNGLGHAFKNMLYLFKPEGLEFLSADLLLNGLALINLPAPQQIGSSNTYSWKIMDYLSDEGLPGFYQVDENYYIIQLRFLGDCALEDGATIALSAKGRTVCQTNVQTEKTSPHPLNFVQRIDHLDSLYSLEMSFHSDQTCEDDFEVRVKLTSINNNSLKDGQKINFSFRKELSLLSDQIQPLHNITKSQVDVSRYLDWETMQVSLEKGISKGDSIVFSFPLEKTCLAPCKSTDFEVKINVPLQIDCPTVNGGQCEQLRQVQAWSFDDVVMGPVVQLLDHSISAKRLNNGTEEVDLTYLMKNTSPFSAAIQYVIRFYFDANGDGQLDGGDTFVTKDTFGGQDLKAYEQLWVKVNKTMPGEYTCRLIAVIDLEDNPCLCLSDTLILEPALIAPQIRHYDICFDDEIEVGFETNDNYKYNWQDSSRLTRIRKSLANYNYPLMINGGEFVYDTITLNVEKFAGCQVVDTVFIRLYNVDAELMQLDEILCYGDSNASLRAKGIGPYNKWTYKWQGRLDTSANIKGLSEGSYIVQLVDKNGCMAMDTIEIATPAPLKDSLGLTSEYNGYNVSCFGGDDGSAEINVVGGTPLYSYEWQGQLQGDSVTLGLKAGWVHITVTDANGCKIADSILLNEPPQIEIEGTSKSAGCDDLHGGEIAVNARGGVPGYTYSWDNNEMGKRIAQLAAGSYKVTITDANGCVIDTMITIDQLEGPEIDVNIMDSTIVYGESVQLKARITGSAVSIKWLPKDLVDCDTCRRVIVSPVEDQEYIVEVTDSNGCTSLASLNIFIKYVEDVYVPNVFSPNGDGINDGFTVYSSPSVERILWLEVYDRWGEFMFRNEDFDLNNPQLGWDGTFRSQAMNPGVYVYVTEVLFRSGKREVLSGDVTLVR